MADWHFRYRRIIDAYRTVLRANNPAACQAVDGKMEEQGEGWVCDDDIPDLNALWTASQIAKKWGFQRWDIDNWVRAGAIKRHETDKGPRYRVGDVLAYFSQKNRKP